jgi:scyllo-inositol 2-dehydrogenase (NADP+)
MINTIVIGYGYSGRHFHGYLIGLADGLSLYGVASRDADRRQQAAEDHPGIVCFENLDQAIADKKVDLIVIATPHDTHAELAIKAMDAGKHVVTDKIMSMNVAEADAMIETGRRNNVLLSVFQNRRWDWDYLTIRRVIDDGLLGDPYLFQVAIMRYGAPRGWRAIGRQSGGILYDWPAHFIDQALQLVDSPVTSVTCDIQEVGHWESDIGNYANLVIRFDNGVLYQIEIGNLAKAPKPRWYVLGDLGALVKHGLDPQEGPMVEGNIDAAEEDPATYARVWTESGGEKRELVVESVRGSWKSYYRNISDFLNGDADLIVKPEQIRRVMQVYDAAIDSAKSGVPVALSP